jgi:hypothetical protein
MGVQHLECDATLRRVLLREIHGARAARAERPQDAVRPDPVGMSVGPLGVLPDLGQGGPERDDRVGIGALLVVPEHRLDVGADPLVALLQQTRARRAGGQPPRLLEEIAHPLKPRVHGRILANPRQAPRAAHRTDFFLNEKGVVGTRTP